MIKLPPISGCGCFKAIPELNSAIENLQSAIVEQAKKSGETIMPG